MMSVPLPVLTTTRLSLRPVTAGDLSLMVNLNSDPAVMAHILGRAATIAETTAEWSERLSQRTDVDSGLGYWAGFHEGEFVGWWGASACANDPEMSSISYRLRRAAWGRGLVTEGAFAMVAQAFSTPTVTRVVASTMAVNHASRRVLQKVGLVHVGTHVRQWDAPILGAEQGEAEYELRRPDAHQQPLTEHNKVR
jgi:RimJ/RimL family protein N-acetyltransferase